MTQNSQKKKKETMELKWIELKWYKLISLKWIELKRTNQAKTCFFFISGCSPNAIL